MSLRSYRRSRIVILNASASILEAARAFENNQIGTIIVQDEGNIVGIVTDRDITIRAVGHELDPKSTTLRQVMSTGVATLPLRASRMDAIKLMQERGVRRIPLTEENRVVGMVTLDDFVLDEVVPIDELATAIRTQIGDGGPVMPKRRKGQSARSEGNYRRLVGSFKDRAKLETTQQAETGLNVSLSSLLKRLTPEEAKDLLAQLPLKIQEMMQSLPPGPDKAVTREQIEMDIVQALGVDLARAAEILLSVGWLLDQNVSAGQIEDILGQLPRGLKEIFPSYFEAPIPSRPEDAQALLQ